MRGNGVHLLVFLAPLALLAVGIVWATYAAKRPITEEPKDPSWEMWFAIGAFALGLVMLLVGQPVGGLLWLLAAVWGVTALYRFLRVKQYIATMRQRRA